MTEEDVVDGYMGRTTDKIRLIDVGKKRFLTVSWVSLCRWVNGSVLRLSILSGYLTSKSPD